MYTQLKMYFLMNKINFSGTQTMLDLQETATTKMR